MNDRISNHPNRWKLTPVTGQTNVYDLERADDPTVAGTPLNKATFLPDAVAAAVEAATGASDVALPADALDALASAMTDIGTRTNVCKLAFGSYTGAGGTTTTKAVTLTFSFKPRFLIVARDTTKLFTNTLAWVYNVTDGVDNNNFTYVDGETSISWTNDSSSSSDRPANRRDTSGTNYFYFAVGVD